MDKRAMERLTHNLAMLCRHRDEVLRDINTNNIMLTAVMPGTSFGGDRVQTSNLASPQERAVENAFARLERKLKSLEDDILDTKIAIQELEKEMSDIGFLIGKLNDEARKFVEMRYEKRKSGKVISIELHLSKNSVWKLRDDILDDLSKWLNYRNRTKE